MLCRQSQHDAGAELVWDQRAPAAAELMTDAQLAQAGWPCSGLERLTEQLR